VQKCLALALIQLILLLHGHLLCKIHWQVQLGSRLSAELHVRTFVLYLERASGLALHRLRCACSQHILNMIEFKIIYESKCYT
jgi:hypothetical protein